MLWERIKNTGELHDRRRGDGDDLIGAAFGILKQEEIDAMDNQDVYAIITASARERGALWLRDNVLAPYGVTGVSELTQGQAHAVLATLRASILTAAATELRGIGDDTGAAKLIELRWS